MAPVVRKNSLRLCKYIHSYFKQTVHLGIKYFRYVDFVNIMCYDYHAFVWYLPFTGPNAPLFANANDLGYEKTLNTNHTVNVWINSGMPKKKIMVGVPIYGHSWR